MPVHEIRRDHEVEDRQRIERSGERIIEVVDTHGVLVAITELMVEAR